MKALDIMIFDIFTGESLCEQSFLHIIFYHYKHCGLNLDA